MKNVTLCALSIMSMNSYAAVEHFNEKQWTTGEGASGHIEILQESITQLTPEEKKNFSYRLTAATQAYYPRAHSNISMQGQHSVDVVNTSNIRQNYQITFYLCVLTKNCSNNTYTIYLNAGGRYQANSNSLLHWTAPDFGNFTLQAGSRTGGGEYGFAYDSKPINVT